MQVAVWAQVAGLLDAVMRLRGVLSEKYQLAQSLASVGTG